MVCVQSSAGLQEMWLFHHYLYVVPRPADSVTSFSFLIFQTSVSKLEGHASSSCVILMSSWTWTGVLWKCSPCNFEVHSPTFTHSERSLWEAKWMFLSWYLHGRCCQCFIHIPLANSKGHLQLAETIPDDFFTPGRIPFVQLIVWCPQ